MAKLIKQDRGLSANDRKLVTDSNGAPCCCGPGEEFVYFADCCDGFPVVKMTVATYDLHIRGRDCGQRAPAEQVKYKFGGYDECFYECTFDAQRCRERYDDPNEIDIISDEQARTARCFPYTDRETGGLPNNCDSLPGECPQCEPVDCCIRRYHAFDCDEWLASPVPGLAAYTPCNYGTHARIYRTYQRTYTSETFQVVTGTRGQEWPPAPYIWCTIPACIPERQVVFERRNESYIYDGTCRKCHRDETDPGAVFGTGREQYSSSRFGYVRYYCDYPGQALPDGYLCGTDYGGDCMRFVEVPISEESSYDREANPCDFSGPSRGPRVGDCTYGPAYERSHVNCVIYETFRTVSYAWVCGGAEKTVTVRTEARHAATGPDDPNVPCWPPAPPGVTDTNCPEAVGKLIWRTQESLTDRVNVTVLDRTAYYGECRPEPPTRVVVAPPGGRNRTRSTDIL